MTLLAVRQYESMKNYQVQAVQRLEHSGRDTEPESIRSGPFINHLQNRTIVLAISNFQGSFICSLL